MTNKDKYIIYCNAQPEIPIYMRDWWLDCNCGKDKWDVLLFERNGGIEAFMTYYQPNRGMIAMPFYSQSMGIWFDPAIIEERYDRELQRKQDICKYLIEELPSHHYYSQNFHASFNDWLPFYWKGYKQSTRYNYIVPQVDDIALIEEALGKVKKNINRARNHYKLEVKQNLPVEDFIQLNAKVFQKQGLTPPDLNSLIKLIQVSKEREQGDIWGAVDEDGKLHAALFLVWQEGYVYGIANGRDPYLPNSEALSLLTWEAISFSVSRKSSYDFQGSMIQGVESFFRKFGGIQTPYLTIYKGKRSFRDYFRAAMRRLNK